MQARKIPPMLDCIHINTPLEIAISGDSFLLISLFCLDVLTMPRVKQI